MFNLQPPRHISTLPKATIQGMSPKWRDCERARRKGFSTGQASTQTVASIARLSRYWAPTPHAMRLISPRLVGTLIQPRRITAMTRRYGAGIRWSPHYLRGAIAYLLRRAM